MTQLEMIQCRILFTAHRIFIWCLLLTSIIVHWGICIRHLTYRNIYHALFNALGFNRKGGSSVVVVARSQYRRPEFKTHKSQRFLSKLLGVSRVWKWVPDLCNYWDKHQHLSPHYLQYIDVRAVSKWNQFLTWFHGQDLQRVVAPRSSFVR